MMRQYLPFCHKNLKADVSMIKKNFLPFSSTITTAAVWFHNITGLPAVAVNVGLLAAI